MVGHQNWPSDSHRKADITSSADQKPSPTPLRVFISYSHRDSEAAVKIADRLRAEGFQVIIDLHSLAAGKSIKEFIEESVNAADAVVSILSKYSLVSAWVATESGEAMLRQRKRVLGCYMDDSFLQLSFVDEAFAYAKIRRSEIGKLIQARIDEERTCRELNEDYERFIYLQQNIDEIVRHLRSKACIDLRPEAFDVGMKRLVCDLRQD